MKIESMGDAKIIFNEIQSLKSKLQALKNPKSIKLRIEGENFGLVEYSTSNLLKSEQENMDLLKEYLGLYFNEKINILKSKFDKLDKE